MKADSNTIQPTIKLSEGDKFALGYLREVAGRLNADAMLAVEVSVTNLEKRLLSLSAEVTELKAEVDRQSAVIEEAEKALTEIAMPGDLAACMHRAETGSYSYYDEPVSVKVATDALARILQIRGEAK